jgi:hypothetical protein
VTRVLVVAVALTACSRHTSSVVTGDVTAPASQPSTSMVAAIEPATQPTSLPTSAPASRPSLTRACEPVLGEDRHIRVGGKYTGLKLDDEGVHAEADTLVVFPYLDGKVLLAWRQRGTNGFGWYGSPLYAVDCATGKADQLASGDFGLAVMSADGTKLYFSDGPLAVLDVATLQRTILTHPDKHRDCHDGPDMVSNVDYPVRLQDADHTLVFERGDRCGFEHDWASDLLYLVGVDHPESATLRVPHPVTVLAVDASGALLASDAPDNVHEDQRTELRGVFRSTDGGKTWKLIHDSSASRIFADRKHAERLLLVLPSNGVEGNDTLSVLTLDGGKTWNPIKPELDGVERSDEWVLVLPVGDDLAHLRVAKWGYEDGKPYGAETTDGATWKRYVGSVELPPATREVTIGGVTFRASDDGIIREEKDKPPETISLPGAPNTP